MLFDIMRFNACAVRALAESDDLSIGEYLQREGYSSRFRDDYLIPMTAAVWSTPPDVCAIDFPAKTLIRFMYNHHLLQITGKPSWLTIKGGSKKYVESILSQLPSAQLHLSTPVHAVWSGEGNVILETATGKRETFDHIIFACHSDDALRILDAGSGATSAEREVLGAFRWSRNEVWLHSDENLMPRSRLAWSCWNYITRTTVDEQGNMKANDPQVSLTYWMNDLQSISSQKHGNLFATLNPLSPPSPTRVLGHYTYSHPVLSADSVRARCELALLNDQATAMGPEGGRHRVFAGAWTHYGFHEDGFASGLRAAAALPGVAPPYMITDADFELWKPFTTVMPVAWLFDVLEVVRSFPALLVGRVLLVVFGAIEPVERKKVD
jgi:predicted NAD/FAD-binding protein